MDDALALIVALKTANLRVRVVTSVSGNLPAERCYRNIHTILQLMAAPTSGATGVATGQGGPHPLVRELAHDPFSHGADGLGETGLPAAPLPPVTAYAPNLLVEQARRHAEQGDPLTVVALGPLTNIALALRMEPRLPQLIRRLIVLGGAFGLQREAALNATGDNPVSEWNFYVDPEAARQVLHGGFDLVGGWAGRGDAPRPAADRGGRRGFARLHPGRGAACLRHARLRVRARLCQLLRADRFLRHRRGGAA